MSNDLKCALYFVCVGKEIELIRDIRKECQKIMEKKHIL
jgi:hypothetical protein